MGETTDLGFSVGYHVLIWTAYTALTLFTLHALFGIVRTLKLRLPVLPGDQRSATRLFPLDYSPKVRAGDGKGKRRWKLAVLVMSLCVWRGLMFLPLFLGRNDGYYPMGWTLLSDRMVQTLHLVVFVACCVVTTMYALRGADTFGATRQNPMIKTQWDRLNLYYQRQLASKIARNLYLVEVRHDRPGAKSLFLPGGDTVQVHWRGSSYFFVLSLGDQRVELAADTALPADREEEIEQFLEHNRL